jgi:hypothetical protein
VRRAAIILGALVGAVLGLYIAGQVALGWLLARELLRGARRAARLLRLGELGLEPDREYLEGLARRQMRGRW